jgi:hypothetical protein
MTRYSCKNCGAVIDGDDETLIENYELQDENEALYEQRHALLTQNVAFGHFLRNLSVYKGRLPFSLRLELNELGRILGV